MNTLTAITWANGKLQLVRDPKRYPNALPLATGPAGKLRSILNTQCRWAYDNKTRLCPGIPEANDPMEAVKAARAFSDRLRQCLARA